MRTLLCLRRFSLPILLLCSFLLAACKDESPTGGPAPAAKTTISGILNDEQGFIVPGAFIEAVDAANARVASDSSDEYGAFSLENVAGDLKTMRLRVNHEGFKPFMADIQSAISAAGGSQGVILSVLHADSCCARLTIQVSGGANNSRMSGVEVKLRKGNQHITTGTTDADGRVTFTNVCNGEFNVRLAKPGYHVLERGGIGVHGCDSTLLEFSMRENNEHQGNNNDSCCNGVLRIIPRDSANNAVLSGASVRITRVGGNPRTLVSNGDGTIFREICAGTFNVRIAKDGFRVVEFSVTLGCNDSVTTDRVLGRKEQQNNGDSCCHGRALVLVHDSASNALLPNAVVKLWKGNTLIATRGTSNDGRALFEGLCAGEYVIDIIREPYRHQEFRITLGCNGNVEEHRKLPLPAPNPDSCCNGRVQLNLYRDNEALNGATVKIAKVNGPVLATKTSAQGRVVFEGLCAGAYTIKITKDGLQAQEFVVNLTCNQRYEDSKQLVAAEQHHDSCCSGVLSLRVKRDGSQDGWLGSAVVTIKKGDHVIASGNTDAEGRFKKEDLCGNSTYTVLFSKDGYREKTLSFTFTECRTVTETVNLVHE